MSIKTEKGIELGFTKTLSRLSEFSNKVAYNEDFTEQMLIHTILKSCYLNEAIFDRAAVTGSIFEECKFIDCSMNVPDLEYCKFLDCEFTASEDNQCIASLNNSNFIKTFFKNINFFGCSFAECYFDNCDFDGVKIEYSTLDNAIFSNCTFWNIDFRNLNMKFAEFENPHFINSKLFLSQLPYIIGGLQYCKSTDDYIEIIANSGKIYTKEELFSEVIPVLIEEYKKSKEYFPLANIYIALQETLDAIKFLKRGLREAITIKDFRMIKFYCKLVARSTIFNTHELHDLYHHICRLIPQGNNSNPELHSFMRNIGEIRNILYSFSQSPSIHIRFITNILSSDTEKVSVLVGKMFQIAKMRHLTGGTQPEMKLSENSPLLIELDVSGSEKSINLLLVAFISLTLHTEEKEAFPVLAENCTSIISENAELFLQTQELREQCKKLDIRIALEEYFVQNCDITYLNDKNTYYYNGSTKRSGRLLGSWE